MDEEETTLEEKLHKTGVDRKKQMNMITRIYMTIIFFVDT